MGVMAGLEPPTPGRSLTLPGHDSKQRGRYESSGQTGLTAVQAVRQRRLGSASVTCMLSTVSLPFYQRCWKMLVSVFESSTPHDTMSATMLIRTTLVASRSKKLNSHFLIFCILTSLVHEVG